MSVVMIIFKSIIVFAALNWLALYTIYGLPMMAVCIILSAAVLIGFNVKPTAKKYIPKRIKFLRGAAELLVVFLITLTGSIAFLVWEIIKSEILTVIIINSVYAGLWLAVIFWNGMLRIFSASVQLGIKWRIIAVLCGFIPVVNIAVLVKMIRIVLRECEFEQQKAELDEVRKESEICKTRYPILLVHGVFFRDLKFFNYWGRIPAALKKNGAEIYYGSQESAAKVEVCAAQLAERIEKIVAETGCEKVNIIAHSKGGLDSRYAVSVLGASRYTASLTTINTPHRGCIFAEYLFNKLPEKTKNFIADRYNGTLKHLGDRQPDFLGAVKDLTAGRCAELNEKMPDAEGVYYQSVGSIMPKATGGTFPLNFSYVLAKHFDGENDGLVSKEAMKWGENFIMLNGGGKLKRGISHGDIIDLNRQNLNGFDVREFYVGLVKELKEKGF